MSEIDQSQSSMNYQKILEDLLNCKTQKQWQYVPSIVYMSIKALYNQNQLMEENLSRQLELISEQSVRLKQLTIQYQNLGKERQFRQMEDMSENSKVKDSNFKRKGKFSNQNILEKNDNIRSPFNNTFSNIKQQSYRSAEGEKLIGTASVQQIRLIAQSIFQQKIKESFQRIQQKQRFNITNANKLHQNITKTVNEIHSTRQQLFLQLQIKMRQAQNQLYKKSQMERTNILNFIQQNVINMQKIWAQISDLQLNLQQIKNQRSLGQNSGKGADKTIKQNFIRQKQSAKQIMKNHQINQSKVLKNQLNNLSKQFRQFKLKNLHQMSYFIKTQKLQQILIKYQSQMIQKIRKINKSVENVQKQLGNQKREQLMKIESKARISNFSIMKQQQHSQLKKSKRSEQNIKTIQESLERVQNYFSQKIKSIRKQIGCQMKDLQSNLVKQIQQTKKQIDEELQLRQKTLCDIVQSNCDNLAKQTQNKQSPNQQFLVKTIQKISEQMIMTRFLHLGEKQSKQVIQWQKNTFNSMEQNFIWRKLSHIVTVIAAGLYRLEVGLYPDNQLDNAYACIILNGTPISYFKPKQSTQNLNTSCRGFIFNQPILIPTKSKIWIRVQKPFYGQAFLQILKL